MQKFEYKLCATRVVMQHKESQAISTIDINVLLIDRNYSPMDQIRMIQQSSQERIFNTFQEDMAQFEIMDVVIMNIVSMGMHDKDSWEGKNAADQ